MGIGDLLLLVLMKWAASASMTSPQHGGYSYSERNQIFFSFGIDWDLKPEINIHTLHRTEHLVAIYFKDRASFFLPEWGEWGIVKGNVYEVLVMKTELKIVPVLIDAAEGEGQKPLLGEETSQILK